MQTSTTSEIQHKPGAARPAAGTKPSDSELEGKTAIVTGGNSGLGLECARQFLDRGLSRLILAVRDEEKGAAARSVLAAGRDIPSDAIEVWHLDYSSYDSITHFAARAEELENLDIVVLNAGIYRLTSADLPSTGHEEGVQINYLSTALLTILLLPVLEAKKRSEDQPGRLTLVSTSTAAISKWKPDPYHDDDGQPLLKSLDSVPEGTKFDHYQQYCTSKLLAQFFLVELARRVPSSVAVVDCVNPGLCYGSRLARDGDGTWMGFFAAILFRVFGRSCAVGARALVDAAVAHEGAEVHGQYLDNGKVARFAPVVYTSEGQAIAQRLWKEMMSEFAFADAEEIIQELSHQN